MSLAVTLYGLREDYQTHRVVALFVWLHQEALALKSGRHLRWLVNFLEGAASA